MRVLPALLRGVVAAVLLIPLVPLVRGQAPEADLQIQAPLVVALPDGDVTVTIPWTYLPAVPLLAGATNVTSTWSIDCAEQGKATASSSAQGTVGAAWVDGSTDLRLRMASAVAAVLYRCSLTGSATTALPGGEAAYEPGMVQVVLPTVFDLGILVDDANEAAGPQKRVVYQVELHNRGNSKIHVLFELEGTKKGRWEALAPETLVLAPGAKQTIPVVVSTTFHNGYVDASKQYVLRATPASAVDPAYRGDSVELPLEVKSRGWYVPGPSLPLVLVALAMVAVALRRR